MIKILSNSQIRFRPQSRFNLFGLIGLARQRRKLAELDDHILKDIGITRPQAEAEADRPVWDAPSNWKA